MNRSKPSKGVSKAAHRVLDAVWTKTLRTQDDYVIALAPEPKPGAIFAAVYAETLWARYSVKEKLGFLLARKWVPSEELRRAVGNEVLTDEIFGHEEDLGPTLLQLQNSYGDERWDFESLTDGDRERAFALAGCSIAARQRLQRVQNQPTLSLGRVAPEMSFLVVPMAVKVPVVSIRHFLEVHPFGTFASIRAANHPKASELIALLYEILFLQQKIALTFFRVCELSIDIHGKSEDCLFTNAEWDTICCFDTLTVYLKATVEKTLALVAATHCIDGLEGKRRHKDRLKLLEQKLPNISKSQYYQSFLSEFAKSSNLIEIDKLRSGLLHKKGIADLQPHNYSGKRPHELPINKLYRVFHEQHAKNTAMLLGSLAVLTDDLVARSGPSCSEDFLETLAKLGIDLAKSTDHEWFQEQDGE